jgi:hypothetical protein
LVRGGVVFGGPVGVEAISVSDAFLEKKTLETSHSSTSFLSRLLPIIFEPVVSLDCQSRKNLTMTHLPKTVTAIIRQIVNEQNDAALFGVLDGVLAGGNDLFNLLDTSSKFDRQLTDQARSCFFSLVNRWIGGRILDTFYSVSQMESVSKQVTFLRRRQGSTGDAVLAALGETPTGAIAEVAAYVVETLMLPLLSDTEADNIHLDVAAHVSAALSYATSGTVAARVIAAMHFTDPATGDCTCNTSTDLWAPRESSGIDRCMQPQKCFIDRLHFASCGRQVCSGKACPSRCKKCTWFAGLLLVMDDSLPKYKSLEPSTWFQYLEDASTWIDGNNLLDQKACHLGKQYVAAELHDTLELDDVNPLDTARRFVLTWS